MTNLLLRRLAKTTDAWVTLYLGVLLLSGHGVAAESTCAKGQEVAPFIAAPELRVATLNIAHGRNQSLNQLLIGRKTIGANIGGIASLLQRLDADVVALQEADAASRWSGNFNHVALLATLSQYPCYFHGVHFDTLIASYGTAILSRVGMGQVYSHSFAPTPPTATKGMVVSSIEWRIHPTEIPVIVDLVSLHLDFSRKDVRKKQLAEVVKLTKTLDGPLIVMGDFNADWSTNGSVVRSLAEQLSLHTYKPLASGLGTYRKNSRLDWILLSRDLAFTSYTVIPDVVSDHLAVVAEVVWIGEYSEERRFEDN